ncbi:MAG: lipoprotein NlpD [Polaribacter sp.]|jgi:lipoprotein NlpD
MAKNQAYSKIVFLLVVSSLAACTNHSPAPVDDLRYSQKNKTKRLPHLNTNHLEEKRNINHHKVLPGETLFAIAWRHSLDYHSVAELNDLNAFLIYPGQNLVLRKKEQSSLFSASSLVAAINKDFLQKSEKQIVTNHNLKRTKQAKSNNTIKSRAVNKEKSPSHLTSQNQYRKAFATRSSNNKIENWIWPVNGKVVQGFSSRQNQNKGLDIKGVKGSAVRAAAPGKVVYSGNGLKGYGQLVIIKHNDSYLSAYAHNNKIHVIENEVVKAGQRIADLGKSGSDIFKLHFEIRYKGKPVNPLNYLPKAS